MCIYIIIFILACSNCKDESENELKDKSKQTESVYELPKSEQFSMED